MKPEDFDLFATLVKQRSGLALTREKAYLLESRLLPVVRRHNLRTLEDMAQAVRNDRDENLMSAITEAMTTNESCFFRDLKPFASFRKTLMPQLLAARAGKRQLRIWSAAAASGQEAYSLAMICAEEEEQLHGWNVEIVGTDISHEMIERSKSGIYTQFEIQHGLPIAMLVKYFEQLGSDKWQIKGDIREKVQFREGNLLQDLGPIGTFDVVFCRNVLMYFDAPTQKRVLESIHGMLAPEGILFIGRNDPTGISEQFMSIDAQKGIYSALPRPNGAVRHAAV